MVLFTAHAPKKSPDTDTESMPGAEEMSKAFIQITRAPFALTKLFCIVTQFANLYGASRRIRTCDTAVNSRALCQLS